MNSPEMSRLHIIDTLGAFFVTKPKSGTINWSKVPFSDIESNGRLSEKARDAIIENFETYIEKVSSLGYDAISIDDLAHMAKMPFYDQETAMLIEDYQHLYARLFKIATSLGMRIYVNTDYLFTNDSIEQRLQSGVSPVELFTNILQKAFDMFPEISGVILRIGENDGKDVTGTFLSKLFIRTPDDANDLLKKILPVFEQFDKQLVFRTWTVGAYKIGDLIWNEKTFDAVFQNIESDALIISMKFGDTDFMRYLTLNPLFFHSKHKKIIELQTRREWEGMGTFPSFVGWDYERYWDRLRTNDSLIGIHVWCQTGGWAKSEWTNLTYLHGSSFWNELNTEVTLAIAKYGKTTEKAIELFCKSRNIKNTALFTDLLKNAEIAINKGLYIEPVANQALYFRRTRIPSLLWITWDIVHVPPVVVYLHRMLTSATATMLQDGDDAIRACDTMIAHGSALGLHVSIIDSLRFEKDTLAVLAGIRRHVIGQLDDAHTLNDLIRKYEHKYPQHYTIGKIKQSRHRRLPKRLLSPLIRRKVRYRKRDRVLLKTSALQAKIIRMYLRLSRSHLADQSMGIEILFK